MMSLNMIGVHIVSDNELGSQPGGGRRNYSGFPELWRGVDWARAHICLLLHFIINLITQWLL